MRKLVIVSILILLCGTLFAIKLSNKGNYKKEYKSTISWNEFIDYLGGSYETKEFAKYKR